MKLSRKIDQDFIIQSLMDFLILLCINFGSLFAVMDTRFQSLLCLLILLILIDDLIFITVTTIREVACAHRELTLVSFLFSYSGSVGVIRMNEATIRNRGSNQ